MPTRHGMSWRWRAALAAVAFLVMLVGLAGCSGSRPHGRPEAMAARSAGPPGWREVRFGGLGVDVPASWRVLDGRRGTCAPVGPRPAVILGHAAFAMHCPPILPPRRSALAMWVDASQYFGMTRGVATTIDGLAAHLERHDAMVLGVRESPTGPPRPPYPHASGFDVTFDRQHVRIMAVDPDGSGILERVLQTAHAV
jgi:hypothetical protein